MTWLQMESNGRPIGRAFCLPNKNGLLPPHKIIGCNAGTADNCDLAGTGNAFDKLTSSRKLIGWRARLERPKHGNQLLCANNRRASIQIGSDR